MTRTSLRRSTSVLDTASRIPGGRRYQSPRTRLPGQGKFRTEKRARVSGPAAGAARRVVERLCRQAPSPSRSSVPPSAWRKTSVAGDGVARVMLREWRRERFIRKTLRTSRGSGSPSSSPGNVWVTEYAPSERKRARSLGSTLHLRGMGRRFVRMRCLKASPRARGRCHVLGGVAPIYRLTGQLGGAPVELINGPWRPFLASLMSGCRRGSRFIH